KKPPLPKGRGTAEWRWRDTLSFLQAKSPSHGFAATAPFRQGGLWFMQFNHNATTPFFVDFSVPVFKIHIKSKIDFFPQTPLRCTLYRIFAFLKPFIM
ncbi:MAG: hypothetical protein U0K70_01190, partial [Acutalibacteraceae bacterium]|nr:hypothetical protein [Acutalibacteraceae bacterium]